jgi:hypothetical protein
MNCPRGLIWNAALSTCVASVVAPSGPVSIHH